VWQSSPAFEQAERSTNPNYVLIAGLLFTALLALLLLALTVRRVEHLEQAVDRRRLAVPALVFLVLAAGALALYSKLRDLESGFVREQMHTEARKLETSLRNQANERVGSLARLAARWVAANGTPQALWRLDAANHVAQLPGLRALEWIGPDYRVRWAEPVAGNEAAMGLDVRFDAPRAAALRGAAERPGATLTAPLDLVQGYTAFIAYLPLTRDGRFDGFIAGVFSLDDFFTAAMRTEESGDFAVTLLHGGRAFYDNAPRSAPRGRRSTARSASRTRCGRCASRRRQRSWRPSNRCCRRWCWSRAFWWQRSRRWPYVTC
jgi:sensor domain CHASE-containing protein